MREEMLIRLLNMSLTGGIVILAVLVLRLLLRSAPKVISYSLWAVVLFRLVSPISFSLPVSFVGMAGGPAAEEGIIYYIPEDITDSKSPQMHLPLPGGVNNTINEALPRGTEKTSGDALEGPFSAAVTVWAAGMCSLLLYGIFSLIVFRVRLKGAYRTGSIRCSSLIDAPIFEREGLPTSFVMGILRPAIYLPRGLAEEEKKYILLHEQIHIKRFDHIIKLVSFFTLSIHWFNPLVWAAFFLSGRDMEMSCDEAVIRRMGDNVKREYSASLLKLATGKYIVNAAPLAFGEGDTGSRIRNVLKYKKPSIAAVCAAVMIVAAAAVLLLANPMKGPDETFLPTNPAEEQEGESRWESEQIQAGGNDTGESSQAAIDSVESRMVQEIQELQSIEEQEKRLKEQLEEKQLRTAMRSMNWGEAFTWRRLRKLAEEKAADLLDYAGYDGAEWEDMEGSSALNRYLIYRLADERTGENYRVMISYIYENNPENKIDMLYLVRESDQAILSLYQGPDHGGWMDADIDAFIGYIPTLSEWIAEYQFSSEYLTEYLDAYLAADNFSAMVGDYGGQAFWWKGKGIYTTPPGEWVPAEWAAAATISRADGDRFVFADGLLTDISYMGNHCERVGGIEAVSGCEEQAVLFQMNCDLFTASELGEAEEAGNPIPESDRTVDIWYVCFGRENAPYGYMATLNGRYYSREDAIRFAQSVKFTEEAWEE